MIQPYKKKSVEWTLKQEHQSYKKHGSCHVVSLVSTTSIWQGQDPTNTVQDWLGIDHSEETKEDQQIKPQGELKAV